MALPKEQSNPLFRNYSTQEDKPKTGFWAMVGNEIKTEWRRETSKENVANELRNLFAPKTPIPTPNTDLVNQPNNQNNLPAQNNTQTNNQEKTPPPPEDKNTMLPYIFGGVFVVVIIVLVVVFSRKAPQSKPINGKKPKK